MAVTIVDIAQASEDKLEKGILMQVLRSSDLIGLIPWITKNTLRVRGTRWQTLPSVDFREFNAGYTEDTGQLEQWSDGVFPFGGDMYIERQYEGLDEMIESPAVTQAKMKLQALAMEFNHYFINGTPAAGGFTGLRHRIMTILTARSRIDLATAGDCLKVFAAAANTHDLVDAMHEGIKVCGGRANAFLMNEDTYLRVSSALRRQNLLDQARDMFDREIVSFAGAQLVDVGLRRDQATEIITSTEDPGDGGNDSTSMYCVRFGPAEGNETVTDGDGLHGIQKNRLTAYDPLKGAEMEARPAYIRRIDWPVTLSSLGDRYCVARIYGFRMRVT
jgi:hypothetical protein